MSVYGNDFYGDHPANPVAAAEREARRSKKIPADLLDDLKEVAALLGMSQRQTIRQAITEFVQRVRTEHPTTSPRRKTSSLDC